MIPHSKYGLNTSENTQTGTGTTDVTLRYQSNKNSDQFEIKVKKDIIDIYYKKFYFK